MPGVSELFGSSANGLSGAPVNGILNSQAAMMGKIPQQYAEQMQGFQAMTAKFHRTRKQRNQRKQRKQSRQQCGGAADYPESHSPIIANSMTGPANQGGSGTGHLDSMITETSRAVSQIGGARPKRKIRHSKHARTKTAKKAARKVRKTKKRITRRRGRQQCGGMSPLGVYDTGVEAAKAGLNKQWFDENLVNPNFGGALTVPGGR